MQLNRAQQEKSLCFVQATLFTADITDKWLFLLYRVLRNNSPFRWEFSQM